VASEHRAREHRLDVLARALGRARSRRDALRVLGASALAGALAAVLPSRTAQAQQQGATMTVLRGEVAVVKPNGSTLQPAPSGTVVNPGDEIRTLGGTGALITFFSGTEIEMGEETILLVQDVSRSGDKVEVSLKQVFGMAVSRVQKFSDPGSAYRIEVGGAVALIRGSQLGTGLLSLESDWYAAFVCCDCGAGNELRVGSHVASLQSSGDKCAAYGVRVAPLKGPGGTPTGGWAPLTAPIGVALPGGTGPWGGVNTVATELNQDAISEGKSTPGGQINPGTQQANETSQNEQDGKETPTDGGNQPCQTFVCGNTFCASRPSESPPDCFCFEVAETPGQGICLGNFPCSNPTCTSSSQCAPGFTCVVNTCCGPQGVCAPACPPASSSASKSKPVRKKSSKSSGKTGGGT
jgi:hypothetical protein